MDGSTPNAPSEGLRARKRAAARSAIEKTAVRLALEHGYEHVTVVNCWNSSAMLTRTRRASTSRPSMTRARSRT